MLKLAAILLLCATTAQAATWYVDSGASGANDGTSAGDAWETLGDIVWGSLSGGDDVQVADAVSTYGTLTIGASGSAATVAGRIWLIGTDLPLITSISNTSGYDYVGVVGFEITAGSGAASFGSNQIIHGWYIGDNYIHNHAGGGFQWDRDVGSDYNIVRGNRFQDLGTSSTTGANHIVFGGDYNIADYNTFGEGSDRMRLFGEFCIYRNNSAGSMQKADLNGSDPHIDFIQTWSQSSAPNWTDKCLVENNFDYENNTGNGHGWIIQDNVGGFSLQGLIVRGNIHFHEGSQYAEFLDFSEVRGYNNTICEGRWSQRPLTWQDDSVWLRNSSENHTWINNSFTDSNRPTSANPFEVSSGSAATFTADYNHVFESGDFGSYGSNNIEGVDPLFVDQTNGDLELTVSSTLIAAAGPMTTADGSGSSSVNLVVDDADFFMDGWTIVEGDLIKIGSGSWVRISSIDYGTEAITLASAQSWSDEDDVVVLGVDDMGALEYRAGGYAVSGSLAAGSPNVVTVNDSDLVRMVIFYEDGVPQEPDYDTPYQFTDGGGTVTANIYRRYAFNELDFDTDPLVVAATTGGVAAPNAPTGFSATKDGNDTIDTAWTDNSGDEDGFKVYRSLTSGSGFSLVETTAADAVAWKDTGLNPSTTYYYYVAAFNTGGANNSSEDSATTDPLEPPPPPTGRHIRFQIRGDIIWR